MHTDVCETAVTVQKFIACKSSQTPEYDVFTCTKIPAITILYSKKFSSAKNFVKSDRQAVRQEFIFVKRIARFVFGRSVRLLIGYLHIHDCF